MFSADAGESSPLRKVLRTEAIRTHDGEAAVARDRFNKLTASQQRQLLDFLAEL